MAGLGFKDFQVGEVLTSADVDGYLMQQSVMRFADAGARGSALGTAVGTGVPLAEGMVAYLDDQDAVQVFDGTSWSDVRRAGIGSNAATTLKTTSFSTTSTSYVDVTDLSVSITPTTATSKVLVIVQAALSATATQEGNLQVVRDSTAIGNTSDGSSVRANFGNSLANREVANNNTLVLIDSPGTTSSTTYKVQVKTSANTLYVGRIAEAAYNYISSITAVEVAA